MSEYDKNVINALMADDNEDWDEDADEKVHEIVMVVDRSGSMATMHEDAQGGINTFIKKNQDMPGKAFLTLVEFDHAYRVVHDHIDINEVPEYALDPRGSTALLDAVGRAFSDADKHECDGMKLGVIVTDGGENASSEWTRDNVFKRLEELKEKKGWDIIFLAANQDAISAGATLGVAADSAFNFDAGSIKTAYAATEAYCFASRSSGGNKLRAKAVMKEFVDNSDLADLNKEDA